MMFLLSHRHDFCFDAALNAFQKMPRHAVRRCSYSTHLVCDQEEIVLHREVKVWATVTLLERVYQGQSFHGDIGNSTFSGNSCTWKL